MRKRLLVLAAALLLLAGALAAQQSQVPVAPAQGQMAQPSQPVMNGSGGEVAAGTQIQATLDQRLSTKTSKPGDHFTATVVQPVTGSNGAVIIPAGTKIDGEVTEAEQGKTLPEVRGKGRLNLHFTDMILSNGSAVPLTATLVSVHEAKGGAAGKTSQEGEVQSGRSTKDVAKDVGIGAAAGTVAGLIFGHAIKGLLIGAAAGGGYVMATQGKDVELPPQSGFVLRLDQNLVVPRQ